MGGKTLIIIKHWKILNTSRQMRISLKWKPSKGEQFSSFHNKSCVTHEKYYTNQQYALTRQDKARLWGSSTHRKIQVWRKKQSSQYLYQLSPERAAVISSYLSAKKWYFKDIKGCQATCDSSGTVSCEKWLFSNNSWFSGQYRSLALGPVLCVASPDPEVFLLAAHRQNRCSREVWPTMGNNRCEATKNCDM